MIPWTLTCVILALATTRLVRLVGWDDISAGVRERITGLTDLAYNEWAETIWTAQQNGHDPWERIGVPISRRRFYLAKLMRCPWCVGFWLSIAVYWAWFFWPYATLTVVAPFALSEVVGLIAKHLDK